MNTSPLFALSFLASAAVALAESTAPEATPTPVPVPVEVSEAEAEEANITVVEPELSRQERMERLMRDMYHTPMNGILPFIHDKASADAAAPRLKAYVETTERAPEVLMSEHLLLHYYVADCYGSTALREVLAPHLQKYEGDTLQQYRSTCLPLLKQMSGKMEALATEIETVANEAAAAKAAEAIMDFPDSLCELNKQMEAAAASINPCMNDIYIITAIAMGQTSHALDKLLHAYGHASARREGGFPELTRAVHLLFTSSGMPERMLANMTPESLAAGEKIKPALGEWLDQAVNVRDTASADAAADWLAKKNAELNGQLTQAMKPAPMGFLCPCVSRLSTLVQDANHYLEYATPAFYGSEKLKALLASAPLMQEPLEEAPEPAPQPEPEPVPVPVGE